MCTGASVDLHGGANGTKARATVSEPILHRRTSRLRRRRGKRHRRRRRWHHPRTYADPGSHGYSDAGRYSDADRDAHGYSYGHADAGPQ